MAFTLRERKEQPNEGLKRVATAARGGIWAHAQHSKWITVSAKAEH